MDPRVREDDGNRERGASAPTKPPTTPSSFPRRRESRRSLENNTTLSPPCTVIPTKVGIQAESRKATPHPPTTPSFPRRRESRRSLERNTTLPPAPSFPRRWESKRSLAKQHRTLQPHRHSREGGNPDGTWKETPPSPPAPSFPRRWESRRSLAKQHHSPTTPSFPRRRESRRSLERNTALSYYPVIPNHFDFPQPCQAQAFSARYLIPSCRLSCTDCRNSSPQRLMSLCCTMANIDRTRDSRSALPRVNPT